MFEHPVEPVAAYLTNNSCNLSVLTLSAVIERHSGLVCHFEYNVTFMPKMTLFKVKLDKIQIMHHPEILSKMNRMPAFYYHRYGMCSKYPDIILTVSAIRILYRCHSKSIQHFKVPKFFKSLPCLTWNAKEVVGLAWSHASHGTLMENKRYKHFEKRYFANFGEVSTL